MTQDQLDEREIDIMEKERKEDLTSLGEEKEIVAYKPVMILNFYEEVPIEYLGLIKDHILAFTEELGVEVDIETDIPEN